MSEEIVQHRLIQVQQATQRISQDAQWTFLLDSTTPAIAASYSCQKIITRVQQKELDLLQTLQALQNLTLSCKETLKIPILLRTITRLLLDNRTIEFYHHAKKAGVSQLHPFALLFRQRPDLYPSLLEELNFVFATQPSQAWSLLKGFIYAVYLAQNSTDAHILLMHLQQQVLFDSETKIEAGLVQLILDYPLQKDSNRLLPLFDLLIHTPNGSVKVTEYAYAFLDRLLTVLINQGPTLPYLVRLRQLMALDALNPDILWACLCLLLLKVQTVDEQQLIMDLIQSTCKTDTVTPNVLRIAYLPLYQLLSELSDQETLKKTTLQLIGYLDQIKDTTSLDSNHIQDIAHSHTLYGPLSYIMIFMENMYSQLYPTSPLNIDTASELTHTLQLLFSLPFVFCSESDVQCQVYSDLAELACGLSSYKFPLFLFLLRRLQSSSSDNPRLITHIFCDVLLRLAETNDPVITSKILQVCLSAIPSNSASVMGSLAVRALGQLYQRQPRVWQELKRVFSEWVLRRKSGTVRRRIDLSQTGPIKMELAVLTTMRDVCAFRPRECAPDVLPMAVSLLQSCPDLSMASLSLLMSIINHSVKAGLAEPRSIWQVTVVYLAMFAVEQGAPKSNVLIKQLCQFYAMAGARDDPSEHYLQFKQSLLTDYIAPFIQCGDAEASRYAIEALACFPSHYIQLILPEKASDYVQQLVAQEPNPSQHTLLTTLVSDELNGLRRGLFKQDATRHKEPAKVMDTANYRNDRGQLIGERESELETILKTQWEDARVAPGLRSGYALAMLTTMDPPRSLSDEMTKSHWYRFMVTAFTDVSLTDHLLLRVSSVGSWESFFRNVFRHAENEMENKVGALVKDLLVRLERSTVPGVTCNIFLALTGLMNMTRKFIPSFATSCASGIIDILMKHYISLAGSPLSHSAHLMSEEVQFAARFALGHLAGCIISNASLARQTYDSLIKAATDPNSKSRPIDTAVDLVQFANGYAAGCYVSALTVYPVTTEHVNQLAQEGREALLAYSGSLSVSDSRVLGSLMGLRSHLKASDVVGELLDFAVHSLELYLTGSSVSKGRLFGSTWLCALGALQEGQVDYRLSGMIESTLAAASTDPSLAQHFYHFTVPYATIQYHSSLFTDETECFYEKAFEPLFHSIQSDDASSQYRIASLFALGSLLGLDYLQLSTTRHERLFLEAQHYHASAQRPGLDKLGAVAGLTVRSAPTGNLKSGRVAAAVCGKVMEHTQHLLQLLESDPSGEGSQLTSSSTTHLANPATGFHTASTTTTTTEPSSYSRLNSNTSYLRAIFDQLSQTADQPSTVEMLLKSLTDTPGPLPPVNWFGPMLRLVKIKPEQCLQFASVHAATSFSLSEFLITQANAILSQADAYLCDILLRQTDALSALLELGGLSRLQKKEVKMRRGMNAVIKKMHISESRLLEFIDLLAQRLLSLDLTIQKAALATLRDYLSTDADKEKDEEQKAKRRQLVQSIRQSIFQSITLPLLNDTTLKNGTILISAVDCSITQVDQLFSAEANDWHTMPVESMHTRLISLCELYHLEMEPKSKLIKHISAAMTALMSRLGEMATTTDLDPWRFWHVISTCMSDDCHSLKEALSWIIRVLDAFVVYIGTDGSNDQDLYDSIYIGLCQVLSELSLSFTHPSDNRVEAMETAYLLTTFILHAQDHKVEQDQLVKRIFKLLDMTNKLEAPMSTEFFQCVALGLPEDYVNQNEWRY